jgi:DNA-binding CsgD family transcriptional regulator
MIDRMARRPSARAVSWRHHEEALAAKVEALHQSLTDILGADTCIDATDKVISGDLSGAVAALTSACVAKSTDGTPIDDRQRERLQLMLVDLQRLGGKVFEHELGLLSRRLADCDSAISRLRTLPTSNDLLDHVCEELVLRCRFGRAVLSRVDRAMWKPWMAHFSGSEVDEQWFTDWVDRPIPLDNAVLESRILAERKPAVVYDTESADVHRPIIVDAGHSSSYVVAPIIVDDVVIGFLHADYKPTRRRVDTVDRDVLWSFAQGFAQLYERAVLRERLRDQRERMRQALAATDDQLPDRALDLVVATGAHGDGPTTHRAVPTFGPGSALEQLTERESEVLALVAIGATNQQIAEQLVVAESTVKTHVKHILRKLGVSNRAQAISQFLSA